MSKFENNKSRNGAAPSTPARLASGAGAASRKKEKRRRNRNHNHDAHRRRSPPRRPSTRSSRRCRRRRRPAAPKKRQKPREEASPADACRAAVDAFVACRAAAMRGEARHGAALGRPSPGSRAARRRRTRGARRATL